MERLLGKRKKRFAGFSVADLLFAVVKELRILDLDRS